MTPAIWERTEQALVNLILNCQETQALKRAHRGFIGELCWLKEFCTIKMTGPRQSGHTRAMLQVAERGFEDPLFLTSSDDMRVRVDELRNQLGFIKGTCMDLHQLLRNRSTANLRTVDIAFLDVACMASQRRIEEFYQLWIEPPIGFCIVLLE